MPVAILETPASYEGTTTNLATPFTILYNLASLLGGNDVWGHWTVRATARKATTTSCAHFYQRVSGIWTAGAGLILTGVQPSLESEKAAALAGVTLNVTTGFDDMVVTCTGIAATNLNWYVTVVAHNPYTEA